MEYKIQLYISYFKDQNIRMLFAILISGYSNIIQSK